MSRPPRVGAALAVTRGEVAHGEPEFVQSLQRGLAVIRAFDAENPALTLSEVARATGLARAAARRFLLTLVDLGYMRIDGRVFRLSPRVLELGRPYLASLTLPEIALPHLRELVADVRESATVAVLDGGDIVYVAHVTARRIMSISITIGARDPGYATALGRVLLAAQSDGWLEGHLEGLELVAITPRTIVAPERLRAELARVRRQGWALVDQELEEGLRALAVPVHDDEGEVIAAVNVAVHSSRWSVDAVRHELLPRLQAAAHAIEADLGAYVARRRQEPPRPAGVSVPVPSTASAPPPGAREPEFVQSLQRGLAVIRAFDAENPALTLSEVARATGLARAAARRFLLTLVDLGYMRIDGRVFRLSPRVLELGRPYLASLTLPEIALPHLRELVADVRESATVAVLDGGDIVYVAHVTARRIMSISITIGARDPGYATALGRVLLAAQSDGWLEGHLEGLELVAITPRTIVAPERLRAELARVRRQGWALVDQELEEGLRALAVPVHDDEGEVIAAVNVAVHSSRWSVDAVRHELLPRLQAAAHAIEADLGASRLVVGTGPEADGVAARSALPAGDR